MRAPSVTVSPSTLTPSRPACARRSTRPGSSRPCVSSGTITIVPPPITVMPSPSPKSSTASAGDDGTSTSEAIPTPFSVGVPFTTAACPPMPQCLGSTPWITTWMCSGAAPLVSASAFVSASIIFGTDSSVTRRSYSFTSIIGIRRPPSALPARPWGAALGSAQSDMSRLALVGAERSPERVQAKGGAA